MKRRAAAAGGVFAAAVTAAAVLASPATAANATGEVYLRVANHDKGRTLSGQGVKILPGAGAGTAANGMLTLPVNTLESSSATSPASLIFKRGKRSVALTGIHFNFAKGTLNGTLGGRRLAVINLGAAPEHSSGAISVQNGKLSLTGAAASTLRKKLGLQRALVRRAVGMIWLAAREIPSQPLKPAARPITAGAIDWGFLASWRNYVLFVPPAGSIEVGEGATATGPLTLPTTTYVFPATGGSYTPAGEGTAAQLKLTSKGSVKWIKLGHGFEIQLSNLAVEFGPAGNWLIADVSEGIGLPVVSHGVKVASLDPGAVTPTTNGNSITWSGVPASLTAAGAIPFIGQYKEGQALEPITITAELG